MNAPDRDAATILDALATQGRALRIAMRAHEGSTARVIPICPTSVTPSRSQRSSPPTAFPPLRWPRPTCTTCSKTPHGAQKTCSPPAWNSQSSTSCANAPEAPKPLSWRERKRDVISRMRTCSREAAAVMCADKLHNASSTLPHILERGPKVGWSHLGSDPKSQLWWYTSCVEALRPHALPHHRLFEAVVQHLVRGHPENRLTGRTRARRGPRAQKAVSRRKTAGSGGPSGLLLWTRHHECSPSLKRHEVLCRRKGFVRMNTSPQLTGAEGGDGARRHTRCERQARCVGPDSRCRCTSARLRGWLAAPAIQLRYHSHVARWRSASGHEGTAPEQVPGRER